ncbi:MAG: hypothetical protein BWY76_01832 [bacterium ADurb.Bin429]|nr:MAG: hypothetical protein BWY76_01832 [bacterium ADurb.Bin429]
MPAYNHSLALAPIFPGEDPEVFTRWRAVAEQTLDSYPWSDNVRRAIACIRLDRGDEAYRLLAAESTTREDDSNCTYASGSSGIYSTAELLLSSYDGVIRVFPGWPRGKAARFRDLRAVGGFRIAAHTDGRVIGPIRLDSDGGNPATVRLPWPEGTVTTLAGEAVPYTRDGKTLTFPTIVGGSYFIAPG